MKIKLLLSSIGLLAVFLTPITGYSVSPDGSPTTHKECKDLGGFQPGEKAWCHLCVNMQDTMYSTNDQVFDFGAITRNATNTTPFGTRFLSCNGTAVPQLLSSEITASRHGEDFASICADLGGTYRANMFANSTGGSNPLFSCQYTP